MFFRRRFHRELQEEMQEHLRETIEDLMAQGMPEEEARYAARRQFGNTTLLTERSADQWTVPSLEAIFQDVRYAGRILRKSPAFTLAAILSLGLGIGANTVIFSVVDHVVLRPLPYPAPDQLVMIWTRSQSRNQDHGQVSAADFFDWRAKSTGFASMSAYTSWPMNLTDVAEPLRLNGELVSANFFDTLRAGAALGRTFSSDEDQPDKGSVVVISHRLWRQLGSSPQIVGRSLTLNRSSATVIGVMPSSFNFLGRDTDFWTPLAMSPQNRANREGRWLSVVARRAPNTTLRSAESEMHLLAARLADEFPTDKGWDTQLVPLHDELVGNTRLIVLALQGAVAFLLLITCANLANLLLARASGRAREMAVRAALGAGRGRIVRQLLVESALLATLGGALGLAIAYAGVRTIRTLGEGVIPRVAEINLDGRILLFTLLAVGFTSLLFGLLPALQAARIDLRRHVYSGRGMQRGAEHQRGLLVSIELALACVLLVGASLLAESLARLAATNPGFEVRNVLTMKITLPRSKYATTGKQTALFHQILERVVNIPGVVAAGEVSDAPLGRNNMSTQFAVEGAEPPVEMAIRFITPGYLRTIGVPLVAGRDFSFSDTTPSPLVALVNQTAARRRWPSADPIGKRLRFADTSNWFTVAGVVADIKHLGLAADEGPVIYIPYAQKSWEFLAWTTLVVRTTGDPMNYVNSVRTQIHGIDKDQPVADVSTLEQSLARSTAVPLLTTSALSAISLLAAIMAVIGVYGVFAYALAQRVSEISIRLALGASARQLLWMLLRQGMLRVSIGIGTGLAGAWALTRFLASMLFGVQPHDAATFAAVAAVLLLAALIAGTLSARRVLRIDPASALRAD